MNGEPVGNGYRSILVKSTGGTFVETQILDDEGLEVPVISEYAREINVNIRLDDLNVAKVYLEFADLDVTIPFDQVRLTDDQLRWFEEFVRVQTALRMR